MLKKALPFTLMSALFLGACANNGAVPDNNETPMENTNDRQDNWSPDVKDEQTGPDLDGLDDGRDMNGVPNGTLNDTNTNTDKDMLQDRNTPREDAIEDDLDRQDKDRQDR